MTLSIIRGRYVIVFRIVTAHKFRDLCCPLENVGSLSKLKKYIEFRIMKCVCIKLLRMIVLIAMLKGCLFWKDCTAITSISRKKSADF